MTKKLLKKTLKNGNRFFLTEALRHRDYFCFFVDFVDFVDLVDCLTLEIIANIPAGVEANFRHESFAASPSYEL